MKAECLPDCMIITGHATTAYFRVKPAATRGALKCWCRGSLFKDSELTDLWVGPKNEPFKARDWVQLGWRQGFIFIAQVWKNRARENK